MKLPPLRPGPCDRGDRELIRKRLVWTIDALAAELRRQPTFVADMVVEVAKDKFRAVTPLGYGLGDLDPSPGRTLRGESRVRLNGAA